MRWMANSRFASVVVGLGLVLTAQAGQAQTSESGTASQEQSATAESSQPAPQTAPDSTPASDNQPVPAKPSEGPPAGQGQTASPPANESQSAPVDPLTSNRHYMLQLHNAQRARYSLRPFRMNGKLNRAAQRFAEFMGRTRSFGHYADGRSPANRVAAEGYSQSSWAENIAWVGNRPNDAMNTWMGSSGHRANILGGHSEVGFGLYNGVWVAVFANPSMFEVQQQQAIGGE